MEFPEFLLQLRNQTADSHKALEQNPLSVLLMSEEITLPDYGDYLKSLYGFVYGFERSVFPMLHKSIDDLPARLKTHLILEDLKTLQPADIKGNIIEENIFNRYYNDLPSALGGMYVLEGSTLGGQIIHRRLHKTLGTSIAGKTLYINAYGGQTGSMWKKFLQQFCEASVHTGQEEKVIESAVRTFTLLDEWMTGF